MSLDDTLTHFLGPSSSNLPPSIVEHRQTIAPDTHLLTLTATAELSDLSTGSYDDPKHHVSFVPSAAARPDALHFLAFQCSEFALPIRADASLSFAWYSRPSFTRPHTVFPLLAFSPSACLLVAPLDHFHEQVLAVRARALRWGWSGDLARVPAACCATLAVVRRRSARAALLEWGRLLRARAARAGPVNDRGRFADVTLARLSYWTDNGAAYWYRTEPGLGLPDTLHRTLQALDRRHVPVAAVELDSWFYPHEALRAVTDVGYLDVVPPTGMLRWEPRPDVLPDGVRALRARLGYRPLILHSRHISAASPYVQAEPACEWWRDADRAHPANADLFRVWMQQAADWGAVTYEQDWLVEVWLGVRQLRERVGRIERWQRQLDDAASERGLSLIWCMATPADMAVAVSLKQIVAVRSCDDYRYADDPSTLWRWHLTTSCILRSLGLWPYKDVFMTHGNESGIVDIDGDPNALLEACLATLSAGPVGIGDRMDRTNRDVISHCCRSDGVIIKPDLPLAALDCSLRDPKGLLWAETNCGPWRYLIAIRTGVKANADPANDEPLHEKHSLGLDTDTLIYNWRTHETREGKELETSLRIHEWDLWVVCPTFMCADVQEKDRYPFTVIGDKNAFATTGDRRIRLRRSTEPSLPGVTESKEDGSHQQPPAGYTPVGAAGVQFDVLGVHGETVDISYWSRRDGVQITTVSIPAKGWLKAAVRFSDELGMVVLEHE